MTASERIELASSEAEVLRKWLPEIDAMIAEGTSLEQLLQAIYHYDRGMKQKKQIAIEMGLQPNTLATYMQDGKLPLQHIAAFVKATGNPAPIVYLMKMSATFENMLCWLAILEEPNNADA